MRVSGRTLRQRLVSGGVWTLGGRAVAALSGFAVNAMLVRVMAPADVGAYFLVLSIVSAGVMVAQLGMPSVVVRLIAEALGQGFEARARGVVKAALTIVACGGIGVGLATALFIHLAGEPLFGSIPMAQAAWLAGLWVLTVSLMTLVGEIFRGFHDYGAAAIFAPAGNNVLVAIIVAGVFLPASFVGLSFALSASVLASACIALAGLARLRWRTARLPAPLRVPPRELLGVGLPLLISSLAILLATQADVWIVGSFLGPDDVAVYGAAVRLVQLVMMPMLVMNAVVAPLVSELQGQADRARLERLVRGCAALTGIPAALLLVLLFVAAAPILGLAYGEFYRAGATALVLVSAGQLVNILAGPAAVVLMMTGSQRALMAISVVSAAVVVGGSCASVGTFGTNGVAGAAGLGTALHGVLCWHRVRRALGIRSHFTLSHLGSAARALARRTP